MNAPMNAIATCHLVKVDQESIRDNYFKTIVHQWKEGQSLKHDYRSLAIHKHIGKAANTARKYHVVPSTTANETGPLRTNGMRTFIHLATEF